MNTAFAVQPPPWAVGDTVPAFGKDWEVRAVSPGFAVLVRTITDTDVAQWAGWRRAMGFDPDFLGAGDLTYTVIDWRTGVRGPVDTPNWRWGDDTYSEAQCAEMLAELEAGELQISERNRGAVAVADGRII